MVETLTEKQLAAVAVALGARRVAGWSAAEDELTRELPRGQDPLGTTFCRLRSPDVRRPQGATYTPGVIVRAMIKWAGSIGRPARVVDPGVGSARFLVAAGRQFPNAQLLGVDNDPLAALLARGHLRCAGLHDRAEVLVADYRDVVLPKVEGTTLFVGNPPYVRHHLIGSDRKAWFVRTAADLGLREASQLAGLHVHFFISTAEKARNGDFGAFITAAEWLDVNDGRVLRDLFTGPLGGRSLRHARRLGQVPHEYRHASRRSYLRRRADKV